MGFLFVVFLIIALAVAAFVGMTIIIATGWGQANTRRRPPGRPRADGAAAGAHPGGPHDRGYGVAGGAWLAHDDAAAAGQPLPVSPARDPAAPVYEPPAAAPTYDPPVTHPTNESPATQPSADTASSQDAGGSASSSDSSNSSSSSDSSSSSSDSGSSSSSDSGSSS